MRLALANSIKNHSKIDQVIFLTGDLGFMALEELRDCLGDRFINCGVSEQNMIGISAGLPKQGFKVFVYSIAPFVYARPFEQIRNNIMLNQLQVNDNCRKNAVFLADNAIPLHRHSYYISSAGP